MELEPRITANLNTVNDRIAAATAAAGRVTTDVRLVAVSKKFGPEHVEAAVAAGLQDLGENKVQEALQKQAATGGSTGISSGICSPTRPARRWRRSTGYTR